MSTKSNLQIYSSERVALSAKVMRIQRWRSTPKSRMQMNPDRKPVENQGVSAPFQVENTNMPIPGYLFSMDSGPAVYRYHPETGEPICHWEDKPHWRIDVCAALPEDTARKGGEVR